MLKDSKVENFAQYAKDGRITVVHLTGEAEKFLPPIPPLEKKELIIQGNLDTVFEFLKDTISDENLFFLKVYQNAS